MTALELLGGALSGQGWHARAACRGRDPRLWDEPDTPEEHEAADERAREARLICAGCPVRQRCAEEGQQIGALGMIWGGQWRSPEPRPNIAPGRRCAVCTNPLRGRQLRCCSRHCAAVWTRRKSTDVERVAEALASSPAAPEVGVVLVERFGSVVREWRGSYGVPTDYAEVVRRRAVLQEIEADDNTTGEAS